eukprot:gene6636-10801_t
MIEEAPFVYFDKTKTGNERFSGFSIDMMNEILKTVPNITYDIQLVKDGNYGGLKNGSWNGMVGEMIRNEADITFSSLTVTGPRSDVIDYTSSFLDVGLRILIPKPQTAAKLDSFLEPFSWEVWLIICLTFLLFVVLLWLFDACSPYGYHNHPDEGFKHEMDFSNAVINAGMSFVGQSGDPGRNFASRILSLGYLLFILIIVASYTANLAAFLTIRAGDQRITKLSDIRSNGYKFGVIADSSIENYFRTNPDVADIIKYMVTYKNLTTMLTAVSDNSNDIFAIVHDSPVTEYFQNQAPCNTLQVGEKFYPSNFAAGMRKGFSLASTFNKAILGLRENGYLDTAYKTWWFDKGSCLGADESDQSTTKITIESFGGVLIMLAVVVVISMFLLVAENIYYFFYSAIGYRFKPFTMVHRFLGGGHVASKSAAGDLAVNFVKRKKKGRRPTMATGVPEKQQEQDDESNPAPQDNLEKPKTTYRRSSRMKGRTAFPADSNYVKPKEVQEKKTSSKKLNTVKDESRVQELESIEIDDLGDLDIQNDSERENIPTIDDERTENPTIQVDTPEQ